MKLCKKRLLNDRFGTSSTDVHIVHMYGSLHSDVLCGMARAPLTCEFFASLSCNCASTVEPMLAMQQVVCAQQFRAASASSHCTSRAAYANGLYPVTSSTTHLPKRTF
jgi:hypothetical protein